MTAMGPGVRTYAGSMRMSPRRADHLVTAVLVLWSLPDVPWWWRPPGHSADTLVVVGYLLLALAQSVPFLWRRRIPLTLWGITIGAYLLRGALHQHQVAAGAAVLVAAYGVGAHGAHRRIAQTLGALSLAAAAGIGLFDNDHRMNGAFWGLLGAAFLIGDAATARRHEAASAAEAAHLAERARIARELHDVLVHQLSAITVQAAAARITPSADQGAALSAVEQLGREALTELGHLLGTLRRDDSHAPDRRPAPSLAELEELVAGARARGTPVEFTIGGSIPRPLTPGLELSIYRIVQEALSNAARHAPGAPVRIALGYQTGQLELSVVNEPPRTKAPANPNGGRGLLGIRERVDLYGGYVGAGPTPDGGFAVTAALPNPDQAAARYTDDGQHPARR
ncbi:sensor histidine kinase [Streptomyces sp. CA-106131]|uniref:sensor histidine kinase n=2 Tax=unclassified Streptomyces TaxID=2593676 RepID=UPI003D92E6B1